MKNLNRLFKPKSIAVIGGGSWCEAVIDQLKNMDFHGSIWPIHPSKKSICKVKTYTSIKELPSAPDATFIGVNRFKTIEMVSELSKLNAGGAVCFASGFLEAKLKILMQKICNTFCQQRLVICPYSGPIAMVLSII